METAAFSCTERKALQTTKHKIIMAGLGLVHLVRVLGSGQHAGPIASNYLPKPEWVININHYRYWTQHSTQSPFCPSARGCCISPLHSLPLWFSSQIRVWGSRGKLNLENFNCTKSAFHLLLDLKESQIKVGSTQKHKAGELWRNRSRKGTKRSIQMDGWSLLYSHHVTSQVTATARKLDGQ